MPTLQGSATLAGTGSVVAQTRQKWSVSAALGGAGGFAGRCTAPTYVTEPQVFAGSGGMVNAALTGQLQASAKFAGNGSLWTPILPVQKTPRPAQAPAPRPYSASIYDDPHQTIANTFVAITKSDTIPLPPRTVGLWIGGTGDIAVKGETDVLATTISSVPSGTYFAGRFSYLMATNTSATNVVAFVVK